MADELLLDVLTTQGARELGRHARNRGLREIDLSGICLLDHLTHFDSADLGQLNLSHCHLRGVVFIECDLRNARFCGSTLEDCHFIDCNLSKCDLSGASLRAPFFLRCDLTDARFATPLVQADSVPRGLSLRSIGLAPLSISRPPDHQSCVISDGRLLHCTLDRAQASFSSWSGCEASDTTFRECDFRGTDLSGSQFILANFQGSTFYGADLGLCKLHGADLRKCDLSRTILYRAQMGPHRIYRYSNLVLGPRGPKSVGSEVIETIPVKLCDSLIVGSNLEHADINNADCRGATIEDSAAYGIAAWDVDLEGAQQALIRCSPLGEEALAVDDIRLTHIANALRDNRFYSPLLDQLAQKQVLILGRFSDSQLRVLNGIREAIHNAGFLPVVFTFDGPQRRDLGEVVTTLASMSRCVVADLSDPRSVPHELAATVPTARSVIFQPIIRSNEPPYALFDGLKRYPNVRPLQCYEEAADAVSIVDALLADLM